MKVTDALAGLKVVDFSNVRTGAQASQILADYGAEVILVEPVGGSALRNEPAWPMWGRGKKSVQLDLKDARDLGVARELAIGADVVIETFRPGVADRLGLGYEALSAVNPRLVYCSVTGFGRHGPLADLQGYEGVVFAKLGVMRSLDHLTNRAGPAFPSAAYASYPTSQLALQGILAALYERENSGAGQHVETSLAQGLTVHDTMLWFSRVTAMKFSDGFVQVPRVVDGVPTGGASFRLLVAVTADGKWLQFSQISDRLFRAMMHMFGLDWMFDDPRWKTAPDFDDHDQRREYWEHLLTIVRSKTAAEWIAEFDRNPDVWGEFFRKEDEVLDHPQMQWNRMVTAIEDPDLGVVLQPGPIAHLSGTPARLATPAPRLGEYDAELRNAPAPQPSIPGNPLSQTKAPLEGVTVVEFGTYYAAPFGTTLLAELGATVIKLEELTGDPLRHALPFPEVSGIKVLQGKKSVAVDLQTAEGRAIAHHIVRNADIVMQSFRAGVAERLGLDEPTLRAINPDLVYLSAPGYGEDGPNGHRPAYAPTIGAAAGLAWRNAGGDISKQDDMGLEDIKAAAMQLATAVMGVGNSDGIAAVTVGTVLLLGLLARRRGAGGQKMMTSMLSSSAHSLSEVAIRYEGRPDAPAAGAGAYGFHALYRLYEAEKDWVFLAAPAEREWPRLISGLGEDADAIATDPRFSTVEGRRAHNSALVAALSAIFRRKAAVEWESQLRAFDVACAFVSDGPVESNYIDEGSNGRLCELVTLCDHPILGDVPRLKPLVAFSRSATVAGPAGLVGQHTREVLESYGYDESALDDLQERGTILLG